MVAYLLFAIHYVSVSLNFDIPLSKNDICLDDGLVAGNWIPWKAFWRRDVLWSNWETQQGLEDCFGSHFRKYLIVFPAKRIQDA